MQYSDKDMEALINEVETEFDSHLNKSEQPEIQAEAQQDENIEVEAQAAEAPETQNADLAKNEDSEEDTLDYDDEDFAEMGELYGSMTKSEKEAHYNAVKAALFDSDESQEQEEPAKMAKNEDSEDEDSESNDENSLLKSELEASKKEVEDLKKSVGDLVAMLTKKVKDNSKAPQQKAITQIQYMAKSEDESKQETDVETKPDFDSMEKAEITKLLSNKARTEDMKKSDRDRINAYMFDEISIDEIKDLL